MNHKARYVRLSRVLAPAPVLHPLAIILVLLVMVAGTWALANAQPENYSVSMSPPEITVKPGQAFVLTISVTNNFQENNQGGTVDFYLPRNDLVVVEVLDGGRQVVGAPHVVTWDVSPGFRPGSTITQRVVVKVPPSSGGLSLTNAIAPAQVRSFKIRDYWYSDRTSDRKYMGAEVEITVDLSGPVQTPRAALPLIVR